MALAETDTSIAAVTILLLILCLWLGLWLGLRLWLWLGRGLGRGFGRGIQYLINLVTQQEATRKLPYLLH